MKQRRYLPKISGYFRKRFRVEIVLCLCSVLVLSQTGEAQNAQDLEDLRGDVETLKHDINDLSQRLQNIEDKISGSKNPSGTVRDSPNTVTVTDFPFEGNSDASVAIIEYADFDCPFCRHYKNDIYPGIVADYVAAGKVKYFWQDFPLRIHEQALWAARAARCAGEQGKFWEMRDVLFKAFPNSSEKKILDQAGTSAIEISKLSECLSSQRHTNEVFQSIAEGQRLGVDSTPTFLLGIVDPDHPGVLRISKVIRGAYPFPVFKADLDELLASQGQHQTSSTHPQLPQ